MNSTSLPAIAPDDRGGPAQPLLAV
ncbi:MAG: hypothetical protein JWM30_1752, partial [Burkholderia sp.]|nr:hypothetical protein [Burkholderia sp.]